MPSIKICRYVLNTATLLDFSFFFPCVSTPFIFICRITKPRIRALCVHLGITEPIGLKTSIPTCIFIAISKFLSCFLKTNHSIKWECLWGNNSWNEINQNAVEILTFLVNNVQWCKSHFLPYFLFYVAKKSNSNGFLKSSFVLTMGLLVLLKKLHSNCNFHFNFSFQKILFSTNFSVIEKHQHSFTIAKKSRIQFLLFIQSNGSYHP